MHEPDGNHQPRARLDALTEDEIHRELIHHLSRVGLLRDPSPHTGTATNGASR
ncbi:MAG TPA: hypothetical protein VD903_15120 [Pseudonocardia sp.]|nr:hypothetical protein [Pseudonocardia sp.]